MRYILFGVVLSALLVIGNLLPAEEPKRAASDSISTEWRNDKQNLIRTTELNKAYKSVPFSSEHAGVLDNCPVELNWDIGNNAPYFLKGGCAGVIDDHIVLAGGITNWKQRDPHLTHDNLACIYDIKTGKYTAIQSSHSTGYTQGACDGEYLYLVSGRDAKRYVAKFHLTDKGGEWIGMPSLPDTPECQGRWLGNVEVISDKWLLLFNGRTGREEGAIGSDKPGLPNWRLRLGTSGARWEPMAVYPAGKTECAYSAVVRGKVYAFGGAVTSNNHSEAYCYDPELNSWTPIRSLPYPMAGGNQGIAVQGRYILIMGGDQVKIATTYRVGKSKQPDEPVWRGLNDVILCYDVEKDNYSRVGAMPYGTATVPWVTDGKRVYGFGGEPKHRYNVNSENVLQIGTIRLSSK